MSIRGGVTYRGVLKQTSSADGVGVVLGRARKTAGSNGAAAPSDPSAGDLTLSSADVIEIRASLPAGASSQGRDAGKENAWKTDVDISSGRGQLKERTLLAWQPDADDPGFALEDTLASNRGKDKPWDQFAANEQLFGIKSQWDENVYTHKLDKSRADFGKRQQDAERIAREIESGASSNPHVLEERNRKDDSGMTEEDKYSGVSRNPNRWVPPAQRQQDSVPASPHVDPAIISSQMAKPGTTPTRASIASALPGRTDSNASIDIKARVLGSAPRDAASRESTPRDAKPDAIESQIVGTFKQFSIGEREKVSQKKAQLKKEKDGKLQDLLKFSQSFKLNTPVPEDLIPILAKDKAKQEAIVSRSAAASAVSSPTTANASSVLSPPIVSIGIAQTATPSQAAPSPGTTPSPLNAEQLDRARRLSAKAHEFKPFNPAASAFTPSFAGSTASPSFAPTSNYSRASTVPSPALSATSTHRHSVAHADSSQFFSADRKPRPRSERTPILDEYNPFKAYKKKNPDSTFDIELPYRTDPPWPRPDDAVSMYDPPKLPTDTGSGFVSPPGAPGLMHGASPQIGQQGFMSSPPGVSYYPQQPFYKAQNGGGGASPMMQYGQGAQFGFAPQGQFMQFAPGGQNQNGAPYTSPRQMYAQMVPMGPAGFVPMQNGMPAYYDPNMYPSAGQGVHGYRPNQQQQQQQQRSARGSVQNGHAGKQGPNVVPGQNPGPGGEQQARGK